MSAAIGYEDWVKGGDFNDATFPTSATGDDIGSLAALTTAQLSDVWGATAGLSADIRVVWGDERPLSVIAMLDLRLAAGSSGQIRYGYIDSSGINWLDGSLRDPYAYPSSEFVRHDVHVLAAPVQASGLAVSVTNAVAQFTVGRLWAGPLWRPPQNIHREWEAAIVDPGDMLRSRGGQGYPRHEQRVRKLSMQFSHVEFAQAFGLPDNSVLDLQQLGYRVGTTEPVLAFPRTDDDHSVHRLGMYGHLAEPLRIRHGGGDQFTASADVLELL